MAFCEICGEHVCTTKDACSAERERMRDPRYVRRACLMDQLMYGTRKGSPAEKRLQAEIDRINQELGL